jgi:NAD(P)-dependent dehydrogenase (short-subunit alcohol dehydrogenase family)
MIICIGSSSKLSQNFEKSKTKNIIFIGRNNPFNLNNWIQGFDLSNNDGIESELRLIAEILKTNTNQNELHLVLLNGVSSNSWEDSININLISTAKIADLFTSFLKKNHKYGSVVLLGSAASHFGEKLPYSMTKASLVGLMSVLNNKYSPYVRANMVLPGAFESGMTDDWNDEKKVKISETTYQNRLATRDEIVHSILFCVENTYLSGVTINMTSGGIRN